MRAAVIESSKESPNIHRLSNASKENNYRQILVEFLEPEPRHSQVEVEACLSNAALTTEVGLVMGGGAIFLQGRSTL